VPLYEYQCPKCGRFELIRKFSDEALTKCPTCGSDIQKLLSAPAIQFKGTGWYITDYAKSGKSEPKSDGGKSESSSKSESSKSEGSKSDGGKSESSKSDSAKKDAGSSSTSSSESKPAASATSTTTATKDSGGGKSSGS
jgi:putative FmdB family regulatory protein